MRTPNKYHFPINQIYLDLQWFNYSIYKTRLHTQGNNTKKYLNKFYQYNTITFIQIQMSIKHQLCVKNNANTNTKSYLKLS